MRTLLRTLLHAMRWGGAPPCCVAKILTPVLTPKLDDIVIASATAMGMLAGFGGVVSAMESPIAESPAAAAVVAEPDTPAMQLANVVAAGAYCFVFYVLHCFVFYVLYFCECSSHVHVVVADLSWLDDLSLKDFFHTTVVKIGNNRVQCSGKCATDGMTGMEGDWPNTCIVEVLALSIPLSWVHAPPKKPCYRFGFIHKWGRGGA